MTLWHTWTNFSISKCRTTRRDQRMYVSAELWWRSKTPPKKFHSLKNYGPITNKFRITTVWTLKRTFWHFVRWTVLKLQFYERDYVILIIQKTKNSDGLTKNFEKFWNFKHLLKTWKFLRHLVSIQKYSSSFENTNIWHNLIWALWKPIIVQITSNCIYIFMENETLIPANSFALKMT